MAFHIKLTKEHGEEGEWVAEFTSNGFLLAFRASSPEGVFTQMADALRGFRPLLEGEPPCDALLTASEVGRIKFDLRRSAEEMPQC